MSNKEEILPWWQKYALTLNEAARYFGIGYKKLKSHVESHEDAEYVLWNGNRAMIKRDLFREYLDKEVNVI